MSPSVSTITIWETNHQNRQFSFNVWTGILRACRISPHILSEPIICRYSHFIWIHVSTVQYSSSHVRSRTCVKGCPKIILDAVLITKERLHFNGLHAHLTWFLIFPLLSDNWKARCKPVQLVLERKSRGEFNSFDWNKEYTRILQTLAKLIIEAELSCGTLKTLIICENLNGKSLTPVVSFLIHNKLSLRQS